MERLFERSYSGLSRVFGFLDRYLDHGGVTDSDAFAARLAVEELFTNLVKYSTSGADQVSVGIEIEDGELVIVLKDFDAEPFDPTDHPAPDLRAPLAARRPGGLGLHLARSVVDSITHRYTDGSNVVTLRKKLAK